MKPLSTATIKKLTILAFAFPLCSSSFYGCILFSSKSGRTEEFGSKKREKDPIAIKVMSAKKEVAPRTIEATVSLTGLKQVDVYSRVAGRLLSRSFNEGEAVKHGQILFKVDRTDPGENFQATPVESPVNGWVAQWNTDVGSQITTQTPVVQIVDDHVLRATVSLPSKDWAFITSRSEVTVEYAGQIRKAIVKSVARAADPTSGRGTFEIEVNNGNRSWRAGTAATAAIKVEPRPRIILTAQALILTDQGAFVYVIENGVAIRTPVKYEMLSNDLAEIVAGLSDHTTIAVSGNNLLSNNAPVKIIQDKIDKPTNAASTPSAEPKR